MRVTAGNARRDVDGVSAPRFAGQGKARQAFLAVLSACVLMSCTYSADFQDCAVRCAPDMSCPENLQCGTEGFCRAPGVTALCVESAPPPSCTGLAATCGPIGTDDCCSIATPIPGGTFYRGYDAAADGMYQDMSHPATVSSFVLDRFEVTVSRFRKFVDAGMGTQANPPTAGAGAHAKISGSGWETSWNSELVSDALSLSTALQCDPQRQTWTAATGANEELPINCITWPEAMAFCIWDGGYLPTDAEWNYAAAGGGEQRAYPWSSPAGDLPIDCSYVNYNPNYPSGPFCVNGTVGGTSRVGNESPKGDGKWGHSDLGGNVEEWVLDWYATYSTMACDDCAYLTPTGDRVVRMSDWANAAPTVRGAYRKYTTPTGNRDPKLGFRCARPAP